MKRLAPYLFAGLAAAAAWWLKPAPAPVYRSVEVPVETIREVEKVDTIIRWKERIIYREREPETVATAPQGATEMVQSFCAPTLATATGDTLADVRPRLLIRSVRVDRGWFFAKDEVVLTGPLSTGDLRQFRYHVRPDYQLHVRGDGVLMQESRWGIWRDVLEAATWMGAGWLLNEVVP